MKKLTTYYTNKNILFKQIKQIIPKELDSRKKIDMITGFNKSKSIRIINSLIDKNIISKIGSGVTLTYKLNR